ncbi:MAG: galactose-1-phosphate uridylyltransferase [Candidatus Omnitrophica bacterium]|nr:galactose-1-phosphate uridylyltransferase [Candidatus Omnitrophota bacterium]
MPELRRDPVIGRWVIIATERAKRPSDFKIEADEPSLKPCPYCEGNESQTPPEVMALRKPGTKPNGPGWDVRIVPSISGFLKPKGDLDRHGKGLYDLMNGIGTHEMVIMTPKHTGNIHDIDEAQIGKVIEAVIKRISQLRQDERLKYVLMFANHGKIAGGGNTGHLHIQLIATPVTPKRVKEELTGSKRYFDYRDRCVICDMIKQELKEDKRVICKEGGLIAITPFCSRFPFETWIMPLKHSCDFDKTPGLNIKDFGRIYKGLFSKMNKVLGNFPFNVILHTAPFRRSHKKNYWETIEQDFHWHIEIMPRLTQVAGFEWGSGFYINPMPPEDACKALKEVK